MLNVLFVIATAPESVSAKAPPPLLPAALPLKVLFNTAAVPEKE